MAVAEVVAHVAAVADMVAEAAHVRRWAPAHRIPRHGLHQKFPGRKQPLPDLRLNRDLRFLKSADPALDRPQRRHPDPRWACPDRRHRPTNRSHDRQLHKGQMRLPVGPV